MIKWLLLVLGAAYFYYWFKGKERAAQARLAQAQLEAQRKGAMPQVMVQCQLCHVHLPKSEAIKQEDRFYCSAQHLYALDHSGWLGAALWRPSPNHDSRPDGCSPDLVVMHHISLPPSEFQKRICTQYIIDFFQNTLDPTVHPYFAEISSQKVSSHFLISRQGQIFQLVSTKQRAWHAGVSEFLGRERCNDFSIGIEMEGDGDSPFEEIQYQELTTLIQYLEKAFPQLQFAGHSDIAPQRKTDPGKYFDWAKLQKTTLVPEKNFPFGLGSR